MFRKFAFALVAVALGISPCLAENGKHGPKAPTDRTTRFYEGDTGTHEILGIKGQPKGIIAVLIGLAKDGPGQTPTTSTQKRVDKSTPLLLKGAQGPTSAAKSAVPGPVPLKEQMKGRMKSRIQERLKNGGK